jgi:NTP pyrophosphatase (non-canonical NTP hydrolase)
MLSEDIALALNQFSKLVHDNAQNKGFYEGTFNDAEKIALMHSELSEALESLRAGDPVSEKLPAHSHTCEELADCIIRILDYAWAKNYNIGWACVEKHAFNLNRPHKHGKVF